MTSPLRKKRPTTRPSTLRSKSADARLAGLAAFVTLFCAPALLRADDDDFFDLPAVKPAVVSEEVTQPAARPIGSRWSQRNIRLQRAAFDPEYFEGDLDAATQPPVRRRIAQTPPTPGVRPSGLPYEENGKRVPTPESREAATPDVLKRPSQLRKVTEILPYFDYEPDPNVSKEDPCLNLCPRPDGAPCKPLPNGRMPECPKEVKLSEGPYQPRVAPPSLFLWEASNIFYNPLYFEDAPLERYGHTYPCCIQPFVSVGKFTGQLLGYPYQATIDPPCRCISPLGFYRPGECAPKKCYQVPWNTHAAINQAAATTGAFFLFP